MLWKVERFFFVFDFVFVFLLLGQQREFTREKRGDECIHFENYFFNSE
jgi:hypothetical protein